jgi:hypothetical protein
MVLRFPTYAIATLVGLALPALGWAGQRQPAASPFAGEYFCTRNADPICVPFTKNLNQFRRLDFDVCNPRLSGKYPQFSRPQWEEIPFDLGLAETIFKNPLSSPENAERWWQVWLKASEPLRTEGKIKLWRTRIDIDDDGKPETIVRLDYPLAPNKGQNEQKWELQQNPCPYRQGKLYMLESPNEIMKKAFNQRASALGDIIHFPFPEGQTQPGGRNGYYAVSKLTLPADPKAELIGATRGMKVYVLFDLGAGDVCSIDWVPTGRYRPLKPARPNR